MFSFELDPLYLFYGSMLMAVVLAGEAAYLVFGKASDYRTGVNRRLNILEKEPDREAALIQLRRERGLTADGGFSMTVISLNRLIVQSGLPVSLWQLALGAALAAAATFAISMHFNASLLRAGILATFMAPLAPLGVLLWYRKRRREAFGSLFPEAIDIIVRSLRAGHPVPVAIAMVAREMSDPLGTEFGIVADEITYGADLESAMRNLMTRVGQDDLPLFVTSVAIQSATGGNLSQVLANLTKVIRERFKMRRKIRALSSEGKTSAIILGATPFILFAIVNWMSPEFYGEVWDHPYTFNGLAGAGVWMFFGIMVMRKMINFRF